MEDPKNEIEDVIRLLTQSPPAVQRRTVETYFTKDASFTHPFCRTSTFDNQYINSRFFISAIYRWYKIMSPRIELNIDSIAYDEANLLLYISMRQIFSIFLFPFHRANVSLVTVLKLRPSHLSPANASPVKYLIASQNDLYAPDQFMRFLSSGLTDFFIWGWQLWATVFCVLGAVVLSPVTWYEERYMRDERSVKKGGGWVVQEKKTEESGQQSARLLTASAVEGR